MKTELSSEVNHQDLFSSIFPVCVRDFTLLFVFFLFYFIYASLHIHIVQKYGIIHSLRLSVSNLKFIESFMLIRIFSRMFPFPVFLSKIVIKRNNQKKEHSRDDSYYHKRWTVERFDVWRQYCSHSWLRLP